MPQFRKKPVVVEAKQWFEPGDPLHDPSMVVERKGNSVSPPDYVQNGDLRCVIRGDAGVGPAVYVVRTLNGDVRVWPGEWIITGVQGEKYPCNPDIFEATYEPV